MLINDQTSPDNGGTIFIVPGATGRWKRLYSGAANVRWFGAKCDIVYTDDTLAIQNAVNACNDVVIDGISLITNTIQLRSSNSGTSFTGISKSTSGLRAAKPANAPAGYVLPQFDMLLVPAATATSASISVSNIQLIFYGNDNFGDKAAIRIQPGKTTSWMRLDNIDIIGSPSLNRQGTGLLIETVYSESTKGTQYYLDFANFTNFTSYFLKAGVVLNNIIDYPPDQIPEKSKSNTNFINGNLFNTFVINDTITPVRIHTDASLDVQMTGHSQLDNNYFKNFILEHHQAEDAVGVRIEGGTNNVFDMAHFDVGRLIGSS